MFCAPHRICFFFLRRLVFALVFGLVPTGREKAYQLEFEFMEETLEDTVASDTEVWCFFARCQPSSMLPCWLPFVVTIPPQKRWREEK